jgi:hypothetical protein
VQNAGKGGGGVTLKRMCHENFGAKTAWSHVLEFLNNPWGLGTEQEYRVIVPARETTQPGGIGSLESILGLLKSLTIRALLFNAAYSRGYVLPG